MFADVPAACAPSVLLATMTLFMYVYDDDEFCSRYSLDEDDDDTFFLCATLCRAPSAIDVDIEADMTLISLITRSSVSLRF